MTSLAQRQPLIRGEQVYLRAAERSDIGDFVRWFNDAEVVRNLARYAPMSEAAETSWFDRMLEAQGRTDHFFVICLRENGRAIGTIGLHDVDLRDGRAEFGIAIGEKDAWGKGYGTDALRAICDFGFGELRLERIGLFYFQGNDRGRRSYEKAGFTHEGTMRRANYGGGAHRDVHIMGMLRDEWLRDRAQRQPEQG
jgi:RimJ/RimL family protein N-acetyltransferase